MVVNNEKLQLYCIDPECGHWTSGLHGNEPHIYFDVVMSDVPFCVKVLHSSSVSQCVKVPHSSSVSQCVKVPHSSSVSQCVKSPLRLWVNCVV